jgi:hypothetical protein
MYTIAYNMQCPYLAYTITYNWILYIQGIHSLYDLSYIYVWSNKDAEQVCMEVGLLTALVDVGSLWSLGRCPPQRWQGSGNHWTVQHTLRLFCSHSHNPFFCLLKLAESGNNIVTLLTGPSGQQSQQAPFSMLPGTTLPWPNLLDHRTRLRR